MARFDDLAKKAKGLSAQTSARVAAAGDSLVADGAQMRGTEVDESSSASRAEVADAAAWLRAQIEMRRPAAGPVRGTWSLGLGSLLAAHPRVPSSARGLVGKLDRYGGLTISESGLAIDNADVAWNDITEIRTQNVVDYLMFDGMAQQLDSLPIPRFPGRRKLVSAVSGGIVALLLAAAEKQISTGGDIQIPAEVEYRGLVRSKKIAPGILAALVLTDPSVNRCFIDTAAAHGVRVLAGSVENRQNAEQRAAALRSKLASVQARVGDSSGL